MLSKQSKLKQSKTKLQEFATLLFNCTEYIIKYNSVKTVVGKQL